MIQQSISPPRAGAPKQVCPQCQAPIPANPDFVSWCDQCNWNLKLDHVPQPKSAIEAFYLKLSQRLSRELFEGMAADPVTMPRPAASTVLALGVAALVQLGTVLLTVLGLVLLAQDWPNLVLITIGLLCLGIAWLIRPQLGKLPSDIAPPQDFPTLYAITNRIAAHLGAAPIRAIVVDRNFNASFQQVGLRRQPVITVGLPLFAILSPQEQVAILAHEVAHGVNGDPLRGGFIGTAVGTLMRWNALLRPDGELPWSSDGTGSGFIAFISTIVSRLVMQVLSVGPWLAGYALTHLLWRDSQRAEYLADILAARASGTAAMLSALEKLHYVGTFLHTVQRLAVGRGGDAPRELVPALRQRVAALPEHEIERLRRLELLDNSRLDTTHPPTAYRVRYLQAHAITEPAVQLSDEEAVRLERELLSLQPRLQRELVDEYRNHL
ncbi:MAG TPA: M48 family metalloprotease [Roseiflexaceae bacterium]|nr:M48 family metalloprotease [Roseiflexaceae bacterium]